MTFLYIILGLIAALIFFVWGTYNRLITFGMRVKEAFADIDVQLKRRNDLIPNLIETVKGYVKHEKETLEKIVQLRSGIANTKEPGKLAELDNQMSKAIGGLNIQIENYPDLKANQNFMELQRELSDTEDKISYSRRFYNQAVLDYNTGIALFPASIVARFFKFTKEEFFKAKSEERENVKVKFD